MSEVKMGKSSLDGDVLRETYPPNSYKSKEENRKKVEKVATGNEKKKSSFLTNFFENDLEDVFHYIFQDVLIPAAKRMLADALNNGVEMWLFDRSSNKSGEYVSYDGYSRRRGQSERREATHSGRRLRYITFDTRSEAQVVLNNLCDLCDEYDGATVADYYDLAGVLSDYTDNKYGWTELGDCRIRYDRKGYVIDLPRPKPIE